MNNIKTPPVISIIIPAYNTENYIDECLRNLFTQNLDSCEIIIVNDGSTDSTPKIINKYIMKYPQIKLINHKKNRFLYIEATLSSPVKCT